MQLRCSRCGHLIEYTQLPPRFCSNCGRPLSTHVPALENEPTVVFSGPVPQLRGDHPETVGGYQVLRHLGGGGMGNVYEVEELETGRRVALKLIRPEYADSPESVERFRREGRLASTILHPRCVFVLGADEHEGRPYIVMELMPGQNLHDLIDNNGPLQVRDAVAKILDVIDGLIEAHRCGVIHRDVKPSNCFLDSESRVKVGDFGLAKSFVNPEQLTRTGGFLGTILFASPEQIRNDRVNHQSDIYSVCATLYFLLTGRAPFQDVDPAATLARAVTDPAPSMRRFRPELPRTLDEVVLRGLARSRRHRWQTLEDLRLALLPFLDSPPALDIIGWRATAFVVDFLLFLPLLLLVGLLVPEVAPEAPLAAFARSLAITISCGFLYFGLPEWWWGCTPGKWLTRLRVWEAHSTDRPHLGHALLRTFWFFLILEFVPQFLSEWLPRQLLFDFNMISARVLAGLLLAAVVPLLSTVPSVLLISATMRRKNGFRGVHELLSGTRVIRLPSQRSRLRTVRVPQSASLPLTENLPQRFGPFAVRSLIRTNENELLANGEDALLSRPVWLWLRRDESLMNAARRKVVRPTRCRWLSGGNQDHWIWDASVAAPGCLLVDLVAHVRRLSWADTLHLLEQLAGELEAASQDGTLPAKLSPEQLWIQPGGQLLLLDAPLRTPTPTESPLDLLRQTAALCLEGRVRPPALLAAPVQAPIPVHASKLLADLMADRLGDFTTLRKQLAEAHERPEQITQPRRTLQIALASLGLSVGLLMMYSFGPILLLLAYWMCLQGSAAGDLRKEQLERQCLLLIDPANPRHREEQLECQQIIAEIQRDQQLLERDRQAVLASWSWLLRRKGAEDNEALFRDQCREALSESLGADNPDQVPWDLELEQSDSTLHGPSGLARWFLNSPSLLLQLYLAWPVLWAIWAGLTRGGLSAHLAGIRLVGCDGRPAARLRCAYRTLLVWLPVALLLLLALVCDLTRIGYARSGWSDDQIALWGAVSWYLWWLAVVLLPAYVFAVIRWPNRQLHDWLAGVYPVPR
jgi:hypothetical protein